MDSSANYSRVVLRRPVKSDGDPVYMNLRLHDGTNLSPQRFFVPISKGDKVRFSNGSVWVSLRKMEGEVRVTPAWSIRKSISAAGKKIPIVIKEIEKPDELDEYKALTRFHYRGKSGVGRRIPLVAKMNAWNLPRVAGFVELSSSMIVNVARKKFWMRLSAILSSV